MNATTTFENDLEQQKAEKIATMAARAAEIAIELGQEPDAVRIFLQHYFRHVDASDMGERLLPDLLGLVESHYRAALTRPTSGPTVVIRRPSQTAGWTAGGATVVQIVTDDQPFLVDSVTMEVLRQGWSIREVFHPQFLVRRDETGRLSALVQAEHAHESGVTAESWMHLEILPPARPDSGDSLVSELEQGLREVLGLVEEAVQDWSEMTARAEETIELLSRQRGGSDESVVDGRHEEAALASELLRWFADNHFTYLGFREYR